MTMRLAVGTFTDGFMGGTRGQGVHFFDFDPATGAARETGVVTGESPSYLARHPRLPLLYAAERRWSAEDNTTGAITTLTSTDHGGARIIDRVRSGGAFTAQIAVAPDGAVLAVANPLGPSFAVFALDPQGATGPCSVLPMSGRGMRERQAAPWPHSCWFTPGGRILACDMGLDRIYQYDQTHDATVVAPAAHAFATVSSGAGARHLAVRPDGRFAYVANELDSTISVFAIDEDCATLIAVQTVPCQPAGITSPCPPAEIVTSPDGTALYVTVRGVDALACYAIDAETGRLGDVRHTPCGGNTPRHVALSPDGAFAFVSNQLSDHVAVFAIDNKKGCTPVCHIPVNSPACVVVF